MKLLYLCVIVALALPAASAGAAHRLKVAGISERPHESDAHFRARVFHHGVTWERWARHHRRLYRSHRRFVRALRAARWLQLRFAPPEPMIYALASWYGPGFYGHRTACGMTLTTGLLGVANRTLACGTRLEVCFAGRCSAALVVDRGPFVAGRVFDLTGGLAARLGFGGVGTVTYRLL